MFDVVEKELRDQTMELAHTISTLAGGGSNGFFKVTGVGGARVFSSLNEGGIIFFKVKPRILEIDFFTRLLPGL